MLFYSGDQWGWDPRVRVGIGDKRVILRFMCPLDPPTVRLLQAAFGTPWSPDQGDLVLHDDHVTWDRLMRLMKTVHAPEPEEPAVIAHIEPIRVSRDGSGDLIVSLPLARDRLKRMKSLSARAWDPNREVWLLPDDESALQELRGAFAGDEIRFGSGFDEPERTPHRACAAAVNKQFRVKPAPKQTSVSSDGS